MTLEEIRKMDDWDVTVTQFVNKEYRITETTFILHDFRYEDAPDGVEVTFSSKYKPYAVLHPKYAFAKVRHFEYVDADTIRIYIEVDEVEKCEN